MIQSTFVDETEQTGQIINVASVPQRSPFRYPGGKTWLIPYVRQWIRSFDRPLVHFVEPFAGGGIVSLTVAAENLADHVTMVELDAPVSAVWHTIFNDSGGAEWLAEAIINFPFSPSSVADILHQSPTTHRDLALVTIVKNRVNRGGILAPGAGQVKHGENGKGLASRWYPETLRRRILALSFLRSRVTFIQGDGFTVLHKYASEPNTAFFLDPPYSAGGKRAGTRLYNHNEINHAELFQIAASLSGPFLMTYDNAHEVHALAEHQGFATRAIPMKNTHHATMSELLLSRDLSWINP